MKTRFTQELTLQLQLIVRCLFGLNCSEPNTKHTYKTAFTVIYTDRKWVYIGLSPVNSFDREDRDRRDTMIEVKTVSKL